MADYKEIKGKHVLSIASDLDNAEGEGQIWFNTTSGDFKTIIKVDGAWASGGAINTARTTHGGAGTQTAGFWYGGTTPGPATAGFFWDGSAWSAAPTLNTGRPNLVEQTGTQTSALATGNDPAGAINEEFSDPAIVTWETT